MKNKEQFIYKATLKTRGWTDKLIEMFLPVPDKQTTNPHYRSGPKANLFSLKRVEELENNEIIKVIMKNAANKKTKTKTVKNKKLEDSKLKISNIISDRISDGITNSDTEIFIHCGPTNSGKSYAAIQDLKASSSGCYLAPLRLLAWEVYDKLNHEGIYCSLLTGEQKIIVPSAKFSSSTVEMYSPENYSETVILDEVFNITDPFRGASWTRVLMLCKAKRLHIITAIESLDLITGILDRLSKTYTIKNYERLIPLKIAEKPFLLTEPLDRSIYVVFSRLEVLQLKQYFEGLGKKISVIYGNLPPENRKKQIQRFINGETDIAISTDAIGQGVNLPADRVILLKTSKFDGTEVRQLTKLELKQIVGRAGRYNLSTLGYGEVGATTQEDLDYIKWCLESKPDIYSSAKISPELNELEVFKDKRLFNKLLQWEKVNPIPNNLQDLISMVDLSEQVQLASCFDEYSQNVIGISNVFKLTRCPVKKNKDFWLECCRSILKGIYLPLPVDNYKISSQEDLLAAENEINSCEVYLWIHNCVPEYKSLCQDVEKVEQIHHSLVNKIDEFLLRTRKNTKVNKIITRQVKILEQQNEEQCWEEYVVPTNNKGKK